MITYKSRSPELIGQSLNTTIDQLRRIKKELAYYQELSVRLSDEVKALANNKTLSLNEVRLHHN
jgi:hypothetical protein